MPKCATELSKKISREIPASHGLFKYNFILQEKDKKKKNNEKSKENMSLKNLFLTFEVSRV